MIFVIHIKHVMCYKPYDEQVISTINCLSNSDVFPNISASSCIMAWHK